MSPINIQRSHSSIFSYNALIFLLLTEDMVTAKISRMRINSKRMLFCDLFRVPVRGTDRYGQPLDVVAWLKQVKKGKHCRNAWCIHEGKKYHVRIVASALPPEKAAEARKKRKKEAKKKGKQLQPDTLFLVGWSLLITNLPKRPWSYQHILQHNPSPMAN